jgi:outer membrane protein
MKRTAGLIICAIAILCAGPMRAGAEGPGDLKVGYVDLRRAFFEYEKAKELDNELNEFAEATQVKRDAMVQNITKLRDEAELLSEGARQKKQTEMEESIQELQQFDRESRQILMERKDDLFREVIEDIQKVVLDKGTAGGYDYILDSRNIMYAAEKYDLTQEVVSELNKK